MVSRGWAKKLIEETKAWVCEGLIDTQQREKICTRYLGTLEYNRLTSVIIYFGSILVGLGILLFIGSQWQYLNKLSKISIIFFFIIFFNSLGFHFSHPTKTHRGLAEGFLLIGAFSFGSGVWLIAQIYQINYNFSAGILFWIIGIVPFAYLFRSWTVLLLSAVLSLFWLHSYFITYPERAGYGFFILACVIVLLSYAHKQRFPILLMIVAFSSWFMHFWFLKHTQANVDIFGNGGALLQLMFVSLQVFFGFILYAIGMGHVNAGKFTNFSGFYKILGIILIFLPGYSLTFVHHYEEHAFSLPLSYPPSLLALVAFLVICAFLIFIQLFRLRHKADARELEPIFLLFLCTVFLFIFSAVFPHAISPIFNVLLLIETIIFLYVGFIQQSEGIFRLSILLFFIHILTRYFDVFWKMFPRSLLFIFGGLLLILGGIFINRKRIQVEQKWRRKSDA